MHPHDLYLTALAFLSELLGTISGFGSSTFFLPLGSLLEKFQLILVLTALLHCFGNLSKLFLFRKNLDLSLLAKLGIPAIFFTGIGAWLSSHFSSNILQQLLGILLIVISMLHFFRKSTRAKIGILPAASLCGVSGFLTGLVGTGGAIRGMALSALHIEKNTFVLLSASIDMGGDILRAGIYLKEGYMDWSQWFYLPLLGAAALLGTLLGKLILSKISQAHFEKIVAVFVFISAIAMILKR